jgi:Family of unknown function (DUF6118)
MTKETDVNDDVGLDEDPAAEAFARLEGQLAMMRRTVEHLAAERADIVIPDYEATLADMAKQLAAISRGITAIADHPAMLVTPDSLGARIEAVAESARRGDHDNIKQARTDLHHATQVMRSFTAQARTADEQQRALILAVGGGALAGVFLWSFLPGTIARAMPESWHWPERIATRMMGESSLWDAGARQMQVGNPQAWSALLKAADIQRDNRGAIDACRKAANSSREPVRCTVRIRVETKPDR